MNKVCKLGVYLYDPVFTLKIQTGTDWLFVDAMQVQHG